MGDVRSRFFTRLPANTPVHSQKLQRKSLFSNILPVTALFPIFCTGNPAYLQQNKDFRGWGEGAPYPSQVPFWHYGNPQLLELLVADGEVQDETHTVGWGKANKRSYRSGRARSPQDPDALHRQAPHETASCIVLLSVPCVVRIRAGEHRRHRHEEWRSPDRRDQGN